MDVKDSIDDIPVQDPPDEEFSAVDLTWTKYGTTEHHVVDVALIPYDRVEAFISGESANAECPTRFHITRSRKREGNGLKSYKSDEYLEHRLYWCSFGPENYGEGGTILPSQKYRLNTRNRAARPQSMRGCTCRFSVKKLYVRPSLALIIYHERRHINKSGFICHGPLDRDALGPSAKRIPYICSEIQQQTMSLIYLGVPEEKVLKTHLEGVQRYCGSDARVNSLASQYVQKLEMIVKRSTHELDLDDQASVRMWVERNKKSVFFYRDASDADPFILGIQTEWQLQQMIRFSHHSLLACYSSFGIHKLKYPLYSLLAFDSKHHALPVAWVITQSMTERDVSKWMRALVDRICLVDSTWKLTGFIIDDPSLEIESIRDVFCCPVLFSLWHVRRSWLRKIICKCSNIEVQRELFKCLGRIIYSTRNGMDYMIPLKELLADFVDQTAFMKYFKSCWVPKIEMWLITLKNLPLASLESCGAIESYHLKLKLKIYEDSQLDALERADWLVHKLTMEVHSSYWFDLYADESGSYPAVKEEYISSSSWHRALQIPDDAITFDDRSQLFVKVGSQKDGNRTHTVWNPGSEFAFCDCLWSMQGNLCKHAMKASMLCERKEAQSLSLSRQTFWQILVDILRKPMDDSLELDQSLAWATRMRDEIQRLVELVTSSDITEVTNRLPLKWAGKKERTFAGKPVGANTNHLPHASITSAGKRKKASKRKNRKRKRIGTLLKCPPR